MSSTVSNNNYTSSSLVGPWVVTPPSSGNLLAVLVCAACRCEARPLSLPRMASQLGSPTQPSFLAESLDVEPCRVCSDSSWGLKARCLIAAGCLGPRVGCYTRSRLSTHPRHSDVRLEMRHETRTTLRQPAVYSMFLLSFLSSPDLTQNGTQRNTRCWQQRTDNRQATRNPFSSDRHCRFVNMYYSTRQLVLHTDCVNLSACSEYCLVNRSHSRSSHPLHTDSERWLTSSCYLHDSHVPKKSQHSLAIYMCRSQIFDVCVSIDFNLTRTS